MRRDAETATSGQPRGQHPRASTDQLVLVGLGVDDVQYRIDLHALAPNVAFLQVGSPSLTTVLSDLADRGATDITLVGISLASTPPARSWIRRVASQWLREYGGPRPSLHLAVEVVSELACDPVEAAAQHTRAITDDAAGLTSPPWENVPPFRYHVLVCRGPRCAARGAQATAERLTLELARRGLGDDDVLVTQTGCQYPCNQAPVVAVHPDNVWYGGVGPDDAATIAAEHLDGGGPVEVLRLR